MWADPAAHPAAVELLHPMAQVLPTRTSPEHDVHMILKPTEIQFRYLHELESTFRRREGPQVFSIWGQVSQFPNNYFLMLVPKMHTAAFPPNEKAGITALLSAGSANSTSPCGRRSAGRAKAAVLNHSFNRLHQYNSFVEPFARPYYGPTIPDIGPHGT